ncbi:MAG: phospholipase D-like domain-containing protein [Anaerovoracaceae bacterium]
MQYLKISFAMADSIDIVVSFLIETGVELLLEDIQKALDRNVKVRILTGNYLGITQPSALYLLKGKFGDKIELKFYNDRSRSFHAKAYIFHYENHNEIYVGSSNMSKSALTSGIEWSYKFTDKQDGKNYIPFMETYNDLYNNHSILVNNEILKSYADNWQRPAVYKDIMKLPDNPTVDDSNVVELIKPRGAQIEALYALDQIRKEGANKSLVLAATGVGKTYLAAFDSMKYKKILFVAHRKEILNQASRSFATVHKSNNIGFFNSNEKSTDKDMIFASVSTLGKNGFI